MRGSSYPPKRHFYSIPNQIYQEIKSKFDKIFKCIGNYHSNVPIKAYQTILAFHMMILFKKKINLQQMCTYTPNLLISFNLFLGPVVPPSLSFCNPGQKMYNIFFKDIFNVRMGFITIEVEYAIILLLFPYFLLCIHCNEDKGNAWHFNAGAFLFY